MTSDFRVWKRSRIVDRPIVSASTGLAIRRPETIGFRMNSFGICVMLAVWLTAHKTHSQLTLGRMTRDTFPYFRLLAASR